MQLSPQQREQIIARLMSIAYAKGKADRQELFGAEADNVFALGIASAQEHTRPLREVDHDRSGYEIVYDEGCASGRSRV